MNEEEKFATEEEAKSQSEKCPSCGANLVFDPATSSLTCDHCGYSKTLVTEKRAELQFSTLGQVDNKWNNEFKSVHCPNCGAVEYISVKDIANNCPYCGTGLVVDVSEISGKTPTHVVPFKTTKESAINAYLLKVKKNWFCPKVFKKSVSIDTINGIYNPSFTFDSLTVSPYSGVLGKYYYVTVGSGQNKHQERRIRYFNIRGTLNHFFDDVLVQASKRIEQKTLSALSPFNTNAAVNYDSSLILGFQANQYDVDGPTCWKSADKMMQADIRNLILKGYSYDVVSSLHITTSHFNQTYKYLLLPIYIGLVKYKNKPFNFFINGVTNKIKAKLPVSAGKVLLVIFIILVVIGLIGFLILKSQGGE
jgi:ribosomal protein S27E